MKQKRNTAANALEAHGWIGLFLSVPLFIIFWAGAITLFYPEVQRWASMPHYPIPDSAAPLPPLTKLINDKIADYPFDQTRQLTLSLPGEDFHYIKMFIPAFDSFNEADLARAQRANLTQSASPAADAITSSKLHRLIIDPATGATLADNAPFELANFLNRLHFSLKLPQGLYIVGLISFFFLVLVFTGIVIQFKKLISNFFLFRHKKTLRYKMSDLHNAVGVISLPFGLMYAVTGVMFNLSIVFQAVTLFAVYQGSTDAMLRDAGQVNFSSKPFYLPAQMPELNPIFQQLEKQAELDINRLRIKNWGDENALIQFSGLQGSFSERLHRVYSVAERDFSALYNANTNNVFASGTDMLFSLHMASFAGVDLRLVYFLLAIGICVMIVAGNVLWLVKQQKRKTHPRLLALMRCLTLGACVSIIPATALAFLLERILPVDLTVRSDGIAWVFGLVLIGGSVLGFYYRNIKTFIAAGCMVSGLLLLILCVIDGLVYGAKLVNLWRMGHGQAIGVSLALWVLAMILLVCVPALMFKNHSKKSFRQLLLPGSA